MGWGSKYYVKVLNGSDLVDAWDWNEEGERVVSGKQIKPLWYTIKRFDAKKDAENKALAQSKRYPKELFMIEYDAPTYANSEEQYYFGGEKIADRTQVYNVFTRSREYTTAPLNLEFYLGGMVYSLRHSYYYDEVAKKIIISRRDRYGSVAAMVAARTVRGYETKHDVSRMVMSDGSERYFIGGKEVDNKAFTDKLDYWGKLTEKLVNQILPVDEYFPEVKFNHELFKTTNITHVSGRLSRLVVLFDTVNEQAQNEQEAMSYITDQLHVALEKINDYLQNRSAG